MFFLKSLEFETLIKTIFGQSTYNITLIVVIMLDPYITKIEVNHNNNIVFIPILGEPSKEFAQKHLMQFIC